MTDVGFDFVDRRVMAAVQRVASSDPNPADPFRGLYISDETALQLSRGESGVRAPTTAWPRSRTRWGSTCSTRRCSPPAPRPSSTRASGGCSPTCRTTSRASSRAPRLVGHLLEGEGVTAADVMARSTRTGRCAGSARSSCSATRRPRWPSARSRSPTGSPPTCSARAWTTCRRPRGCGSSTSPPTTRAATSTSRPPPRCSRARATCRSCCAGPTPRRCSPRPTSARWWSRTCATWSSAT